MTTCFVELYGLADFLLVRLEFEIKLEPLLLPSPPAPPAPDNQFISAKEYDDDYHFITAS